MLFGLLYLCGCHVYKYARPCVQWTPKGMTIAYAVANGYSNRRGKEVLALSLWACCHASVSIK